MRKLIAMMTQLLNELISCSKFSNVVPSDLYAALDEAYETMFGAGMESFETILGSWVNTRGYPIVTITHDREANSLSINQKQFWSDPKQSRDDGIWWIPLNVATLNNPNAHQTTADDTFSLRGEPSESIQIADIEGFNPEDWFIMNNQQTGYYRVNYDVDNWQRIIEQLHDDPSLIHILNRAALLDDIFVFAKTGDVDYELALSMSLYLRDERDYIPWASVLSHFDDLDRMIHSDETNANLMEFIAYIIHDAYMGLGTEENVGEEMLEKYARTLIVNWACRVGIEDCLSRTQSMFINMLNEDIKVNVDIQSAVYCASLRRASDEEFSGFMAKLAASDDQDERGRMIDSLGCVTDENKLMMFLESSLESNEFVYREAEKPRVVMSVLKGNRNGASVVIKFYSVNYMEFLEKYVHNLSLVEV